MVFNPDALNTDGEQGTGGSTSKRVNLVLSSDEYEVVRESLNRTPKTRKVVPDDGPARTVDTSPNKRNTLTVTAPTGGDPFLKSGDYVVTDWSAEVEGLNTEAINVRLTVE
jgi:hypothetical protein